MRKCREDLVNRASLMPGRVVHDPHDPGVLCRGIRADDVTQVVGKGLLQVAPLREPSLLCPPRTLDQPRGQLAGYSVEGPEGIEREAGCILAQQDACASRGFFFKASSSWRAACCLAGSPLRIDRWGDMAVRHIWCRTSAGLSR